MIGLEDGLLDRLTLALDEVKKNHTPTVVLRNRGIQRSWFDFELAIRAVAVTEPALCLRAAALTVFLHASSIGIVLARVVRILFSCDCEPSTRVLVIDPITFSFIGSI